MPINTTKRQRSGVTSIGEIDECECFFIKVSIQWETLLILSQLICTIRCFLFPDLLKLMHCH